MVRVFFRSTGELQEYGEEYWALMGLSGKESGGGARPSQAQSELDKGFGARPPLPSFSSLPPFLDSYSYYLEGAESYSRWE